MDIQNRVNRVMGKVIDNLGAIDVIIESKKVRAIPAETGHDRGLMGGSREEREVDYQFPTIKGLELRKGMLCEVEDKKWKIESFQRGRAMTTITLIEPNRIEE